MAMNERKSGDDTAVPPAADAELLPEIRDELAPLLDRITPGSLHQSIDFGSPTGKEARF